MKIALLTETFVPEVNGVVTILRELLAAAEAAGHEVLLLAPRSAPPEYPGAEVVRLRGLPLPIYQGALMTPPQPAALRAMRAFRPDVIHAMGPLLLGPAALYAGWRLDRPVIASYQSHFATFMDYYRLGPLARIAWGYLRRIHNRATLSLCPSSDTRSILASHGFGPNRIWPGGVNTGRFHPRHRDMAWRRRHGVADDRPLALIVGRLAAEKNLGLLAEALAGLDEAQVMIVGDGPERTAMERRLPGAVFTGYLHGEELAGAYASADFFVFPSVTETFGQVTLEALASGLPVIATSSGAGADLVKPGVNGLLVPPGDAAALREAVRALAADDALRAALAAAARPSSLPYAWPCVIDQLFGHYQEAIVLHRELAAISASQRRAPASSRARAR